MVLFIGFSIVFEDFLKITSLLNPNTVSTRSLDFCKFQYAPETNLNRMQFMSFRKLENFKISA